MLLAVDTGTHCESMQSTVSSTRINYRYIVSLQYANGKISKVYLVGKFPFSKAFHLIVQQI